jgi:hypothetical protein
LQRFDQVYTGSIKDGEYGHAVRANELSARMTGHLTDRIEMSVAFDQLRSVEQLASALLEDGDVDGTLRALDEMKAAVLKLASSGAKLVNGAVTRLPTEPKEPETSET